MSSVAEVVDVALRAAGIPIIGVSLGSLSDRATWSVQFDPSATPAQRTTAATVLSTVAVDAAALAVQDDKDAQAQIDVMRIDLKAVVLALIDQLNVLRAALPTPLGAITSTQALAAIRAKAGTL